MWVEIGEKETPERELVYGARNNAAGRPEVEVCLESVGNYADVASPAEDRVDSRGVIDSDPLEGTVQIAYYERQHSTEYPKRHTCPRHRRGAAAPPSAPGHQVVDNRCGRGESH